MKLAKASVNNQEYIGLESTDNILKKGSSFPKLYEPYKYEISSFGPMNEKQQLLVKYATQNLVVTDLNLYLDVYPDNKLALKDYNLMLVKLMDTINEYEKKYGPIYLYSPELKNSPFKWINSPWPWEVN